MAMSTYPRLLTASLVGIVLLGAQSRRQSQLDSLKEPFVGVATTAGTIDDLYRIRATGVSTEGVRKATEAFLGSLSTAQREATMFDADSTEWRDWHNLEEYDRTTVKQWLDLPLETKVDALSVILDVTSSIRCSPPCRSIARRCS